MKTQGHEFNVLIQSTSTDAEVRAQRDLLNRPISGKSSHKQTIDRFLRHDAQNRPLTIIEYCTEEVRRQGHDVERAEGIERVGWMLAAWSHAMLMFEARLSESPTLLPALKPADFELRKPLITESDVYSLGRMIERDKNYTGYRKCAVSVGGHIMPHWQDVPGLVRELLDRQESLAPLNLYREFLEIHPFVDGNGRTGKVLLNWKNGSLMNEPVFPPNDFWGDWIVNP